MLSFDIVEPSGTISAAAELAICPCIGRNPGWGSSSDVQSAALFAAGSNFRVDPIIPTIEMLFLLISGSRGVCGTHSSIDSRVADV
jgi:hypothetical protein